MARAFLFACLVFVPFSSLPAMTLDDRTTALLADLYAKGGYGRVAIERAAFLVAGEGGTVRCVLWPFAPEFQQASFRGTIPAGTLAIAHTHPNHLPFPSAGDRALAREIGVPVLVLTRKGIMAALPAGGAPVRLASGWNVATGGASAACVEPHIPVPSSEFRVASCDARPEYRRPPAGKAREARW
ncbi:MAG TPA: Mov34/MPN/PAD-1 family protein [Thermoanaerobaculia bacterium]|nr:Mov34/MPN/PAD-1 family protein [Thermoanaerobaculia bacterium]